MALFDPNEFPAEAPAPKLDTAPSLDFTVADVLAWARTKPADEVYDVCNAKKCAAAQFGGAAGREYLIGKCTLSDASVWLSDVAYASPWTFGALVARLEALSA